MKRLFAAILALCLLALPACGDAPVETTPMATTPTPTTPAPTTPAVTTPICTTPAPTTPAPTTPVVTTPVFTPPPEPPPEMPEITPLTDAQIEEINAAWLAKKGYPAKWFDENEIVTRHFGLRYYGTCNGYQMLFLPGSRIYPSRIRFGDELAMTHFTEFSLYAYRNGVFYSADQLYRDGILDEELLVTVLDCHKATEYAIHNRPDLDDPNNHASREFSELEPLPHELLQKLGEKYGDDSEWDMLKYCGTYNDCIVFGCRVNSDALTLTCVGGQYFAFGCTWSFLIYLDGEFIWDYNGDPALKYAFDHNYLTVEDVEKIEYYARTLLGY